MPDRKSETTDGLSPAGSPGSLGDATDRAINLSLYRLGHLDARFLPEAERRWLEQNAKEASGEGAVRSPTTIISRAP